MFMSTFLWCLILLAGLAIAGVCAWRYMRRSLAYQESLSTPIGELTLARSTRPSQSLSTVCSSLPTRTLTEEEEDELAW